MAIVVVPSREKTVIDAEALGAKIGSFVVELIRDRVADGRDISDNSFTPYSDAYERLLRINNQGTDVDLQLSGAMMRSVTVREIDAQAGKVVIEIGPDGAAQQGRTLKPEYSRVVTSVTRKGKGLVVATKMKKNSPGLAYKGESISNNDKARYTNDKRKWFGLSPRDRKRLLALLEKEGISSFVTTKTV